MKPVHVTPHGDGKLVVHADVGVANVAQVVVPPLTDVESLLDEIGEALKERYGPRGTNTAQTEGGGE